MTAFHPALCLCLPAPAATAAATASPSDSGSGMMRHALPIVARFIGPLRRHFDRAHGCTAAAQAEIAAIWLRNVPGTAVEITA